MEIGASVFVRVNKNLWRATEEFGLERIPFTGEGGRGLGIWDGERFPFVVGCCLLLQRTQLCCD
jgi:prenylcysteine oxidase / farnesylcysteine lyase